MSKKRSSGARATPNVFFRVGPSKVHVRFQQTVPKSRLDFNYPVLDHVEECTVQVEFNACHDGSDPEHHYQISV